MVFAQIVTHICITVVAVVGLALRVEHRLTKIETDVSWLKTRLTYNLCGGRKNGKDNKMDKA